MFIFGESSYLFFIPIVIITLIFFFRWANSVITKRLQLFSSSALSETQKSRGHHTKNLRSGLIIVGVIFILIALARPQWGESLVEQKSRGLDIVIALDTSQSMLATDVRPNRIQRAKLAINDLLDKAEGDHIGLIAFAGKALLQCPLTLDYDALRQTLDHLEVGIVPQSGTNLAAAIKEAEASFLSVDTEKILILMTDGEDLEGAGLVQAQKAHTQGVTIYTVGVGSAEGDFVPDPDNLRRNLIDSEGNAILTRLDPIALKALARASGGEYRALGQTNDGLESVYRELTTRFVSQERASNYYTVRVERFQWPLAIAILFLIAALLIERIALRPHNLRLLLWFPVTISLFLSSMRDGVASLEEADAHYRNEAYKEALAAYVQVLEEGAPSASLHYNLANTYYQLGDYKKAKEAYGKALFDAKANEDFDFKERGLYNLGNTYYRLGETMLSQKPQETIVLWETSIRHFQSATELDPQNAKAKENAQWVKAKLDALKQQQSKQQQSSQQANRDASQEKMKEQESSEKKTQNTDLQAASSLPDEQQQANKSENTANEETQEQQSHETSQSSQSNEALSKASDSTPQSDISKEASDKKSEPQSLPESADEENKDKFPENKQVSHQNTDPLSSETSDIDAAEGKAHNQRSSQRVEKVAKDTKDETGAQQILMMRPEEARRLLQRLRSKEKKLPASQEQVYSDGNKDKTW